METENGRFNLLPLVRYASTITWCVLFVVTIFQWFGLSMDWAIVQKTAEVGNGTTTMQVNLFYLLLQLLLTGFFAFLGMKAWHKAIRAMGWITAAVYLAGVLKTIIGLFHLSIYEYGMWMLLAEGLVFVMGISCVAGLGNRELKRSASFLCMAEFIGIFPSLMPSGYTEFIGYVSSALFHMLTICGWWQLLEALERVDGQDDTDWHFPLNPGYAGWGFIVATALASALLYVQSNYSFVTPN